MKDKDKKLKEKLKKLANLNPRLKNAYKKVFGFEDCKKEKYLKTKLDEVQVAIELATIKTELNWIKRTLWVLVCGGGAGFYFD